MSERCKHVEKNGFNCGSYAFNLYKDGIDQGNLCDVHYWQAKALAQPEQDHIPDARKMVTEQEPVAHCEAGPEYCPVCNTELNQEPAIYPEEAYEMGLEEIAFYTTPPQRTWVDLTDDEENEYNYLGPDMHWVIQEIAAKLKEKNT